MVVLANDGISPLGAKTLSDNGFEVLEISVAQEQLANFINEKNVVAILVRSATQVRKELIDQCPNLKLIGRGGVGMDNIDVEYAKSKDVHVINTPAASSKSVAELVIGHLLSLSRFLHQSNREMPLEGESKFKELKKAFGAGIELEGKTLGIIGLGRIGQALAQKAYGLGMKVIGHDPSVSELEVSVQFTDGQSLKTKIEMVSKEALLAQSDFISLHIPAQKEYVIGEKELAQMKASACIVNAARGGTIDEVALVKALNENKLRGAALDVFENEPAPPIQVLMQPKLSLTPHTGGATKEAQDRIGEELALQMISLLK